MTAQLSRERLEALANIQSLECMALPASHAESAEMACMLLEVLEKSRIAESDRDKNGWYVHECARLEREMKLAAPPAPGAVPDEISTADAVRIMNGRVITMSVHAAYKNGWNACRAAMLKAGPVTADTVPDGWKLVPVEPTAEMISSGITAHYERSQIQIHDRPAPGPMECGYVAMLAASPSAPEPISGTYKVKQVSSNEPLIGATICPVCHGETKSMPFSEIKYCPVCNPDYPQKNSVMDCGGKK